MNKQFLALCKKSANSEVKSTHKSARDFAEDVLILLYHIKNLEAEIWMLRKDNENIKAKNK